MKQQGEHTDEKNEELISKKDIALIFIGYVVGHVLDLIGEHLADVVELLKAGDDDF